MLSTKTVSSNIIPPLESGDRLTLPEFERRYQAMTRVKKAELIQGVIGWLTAYEVATPGVETLDNTTVRLDGDNQPQPDALLRIETGGQSSISEDDYVEGAPELIVEIAASTASYDLHEKLKVYRRHAVQEYIIFAPRIKSR